MENTSGRKRKNGNRILICAGLLLIAAALALALYNILDARRAEQLQGMAFGSNMRATADYRRVIADVLVRRAVRDAMEGKQDAD